MRVRVLSGGDTGLDGFLEPRVFHSELAPVDNAVLSQLAKGVREVDLAAPAVVLPDFHHKGTMEMPSSIAVATRGTIRPVFTSSSVNCGMALIALDMEPPNEAAIDRFFAAVRERCPYPPTRRRELTADEVLRCVVEGAEFGVERFGLDPDDLQRIEHEGRLDVERFGGAAEIRRELPRMTMQLSRLRFGTIGPSNHFVELQRVEEVFDPPTAERLGVRVGQLTLQYHGGGGVLAGQVGRLFGRRKKFSRSQRLQMAVLKPLYHLASARSVDELRLRLALYFSGGCPPVQRDGREGHRLMLANTAAMNYGFAFRAATYAALERSARKAFGATGSRLVVDSPHNSIYEEEVGGEIALVHRHNSCRAYPARKMRAGTVFGQTGQAVLIPGTHRTSSYLGVADEGAEASLYSACHGAGTMIERLEALGVSGRHPLGHETLRFQYSDAAPTRVPQLDDKGVDEALSILTTHRLVRPVARMRALAVLH